jgi:DNA-binding transcriptional LysR family regulator
MLELRRLRLLQELRDRGTVAAVAEALQFTPSAVSQQLSVLERETGVELLERAGRGVRLTDAALVIAAHADALLERAELAEADLAAASGALVGRARVASFQSVALRLAAPALEHLARDAPRLRCELVEAEPEQSLPALVLGDIDLVLADEWEHQPHARPAGVVRHDLHRDPLRVILPEGHPAATRRRRTVPLSELAGETWVSGHPGMGWEEMTNRTCRTLGGFDPDIRHRANDSVLALALVARGLAVTLLPEFVAPGAHPGVVAREIAEGSVHRTIYAATRATDAKRPSVRALLAAVSTVARDLGWPELGSRRGGGAMGYVRGGCARLASTPRPATRSRDSRGQPTAGR